MIECLKCGKEVNNQHQRWIVNPTMFIVPCEYFLCEEHKDINYNFHDIYNNDGTRKEIK